MKKLDELEWLRCGLLPAPRLRFGLPAGAVANLNRQALAPWAPPSDGGDALEARVLRAMSNYGNMRENWLFPAGGWCGVLSTECGVLITQSVWCAGWAPMAVGDRSLAGLAPWPPYERGEELAARICARVSIYGECPRILRWTADCRGEQIGREQVKNSLHDGGIPRPPLRRGNLGGSVWTAGLKSHPRARLIEFSARAVHSTCTAFNSSGALL
jgi:hypothetical protein